MTHNLDFVQQELDRERGGFWNPTAKHGPIKGEGPEFDKAMKKFEKRQARLKRRGKWRAGEASWKTDDGDYIDVDYYLVEDWTFLL